MKTDSIEVRVTPDEKEIMRSAAKARGLSLSTWLRMVAIDAARETKGTDTCD
jgi:uncharacterized protein (DUF1778 family)